MKFINISHIPLAIRIGPNVVHSHLNLTFLTEVRTLICD